MLLTTRMSQLRRPTITSCGASAQASARRPVNRASTTDAHTATSVSRTAVSARYWDWLLVIRAVTHMNVPVRAGYSTNWST